jgi:PPK2 family polyphosphate:nucleotide phosphotransferase
MKKIHKLINLKKYMANPGTKVRLQKYETSCSGNALTKKEAEVHLEEGITRLAEIQDKLYAHNRYRILIVLQAMDAAGKDSVIKHIMSGFNPQGVKVCSFKAPTKQELDHDYLWRHYVALPARGEIGIFNRSHYENVLITRVHPEYILNENLPGIDKVSKIDQAFWQRRFKQINRFEKNLAQNGTIIIKFFLHVSKNEQRKRFLERIDDKTKNWKFSMDDIKERSQDEYQHAYEEAITATSQKHAPWFIIPADDKWFTRLLIAGILHKRLQKLDLNYPRISKAQEEELQQARHQLANEAEPSTVK